eukprot:scaffold37398_cov183-Amphora_coffeaeformis.AAC.1
MNRGSLGKLEDKAPATVRVIRWVSWIRTLVNDENIVKVLARGIQVGISAPIWGDVVARIGKLHPFGAAIARTPTVCCPLSNGNIGVKDAAFTVLTTLFPMTVKVKDLTTTGYSGSSKADKTEKQNSTLHDDGNFSTVILVERLFNFCRGFSRISGDASEPILLERADMLSQSVFANVEEAQIV